MRIDLFADWFDPRVKLESLFFFFAFPVDHVAASRHFSFFEVSVVQSQTLRFACHVIRSQVAYIETLQNLCRRVHRSIANLYFEVLFHFNVDRMNQRVV